jgi:hypothetical protein
MMVIGPCATILGARRDGPLGRGPAHIQGRTSAPPEGRVMIAPDRESTNMPCQAETPSNSDQAGSAPTSAATTAMPQQ